VQLFYLPRTVSTEVGGVVVALVLLVYSNYQTLVIIVDMVMGVPFLQVSELFGCVYELFASTILFELNNYILC